jgi:hypothetical protein
MRFAGLPLVALFLVALSLPAEAKVDAFDITVTHDATATDHVVVVTTTIATANSINPKTLNVFLRSDLDSEFRPQPGRTGIQVQLVQVDPQTSRSVVALPTDGEWIVLPFANVGNSDYSPLQSADQYPIISFRVPWSGSSNRIRPPASSSTLPTVLAIGGGAVVAGLLTLVAFRVLDRRRQSASAVVVGTDEPA